MPESALASRPIWLPTLFRATSPLKCVLLFLGACPMLLTAQTLDPNFRPSPASPVTGIAMQADGKALVAGWFDSVNGSGIGRLARINPDGSLDAGFNPRFSGPDRWVWAVAVEKDGKIIVGGEFSGMGTVPRSRIGRLLPNGLIDAEFNPGADGLVRCLAIQSNGKILLGGDFTTIAGQPRNRIARLNADGSLDSDFNPGADDSVNCFAIQPNGQILVGGSFSNLGGAARASLARLNENGTLDSGFSPGIIGSVTGLALEREGTILVAGGTARLSRFNTNGTRDMGFNPSPSAEVFSVALQSDGKILVGGNFASIGGATRSRIARLETNGSADPTFNVGTLTSSVYSVAIQEDGQILMGGDFLSVAGTSRNYLARLQNSASVSELSVEGTSRINWVRSGSTPLLEQVDFSLWDGSHWSDLGEVQNSPDGPSVNGLSLPPGGLVRARGRTGSNYQGMIERFLVYGTPSLPELEMSVNGSGPVESGFSTLSFELGMDEPSSTQVLTLENKGEAAITGLALQISGPGASLFSVGTLNSTTLAPGQSLEVPVIYASQAEGLATPVLNILSNDPVKPLVYVYLTGVKSRVDLSFNANLSFGISSIASEPSGAILIGGAFTTVSGIPRNRLARLDRAGTVVPAFNPGPDIPPAASVETILAHPNGGVFVGGTFSSLAGQSSPSFGRIGPDGVPSAPIATEYLGPALGLAMQADGKVLVVGDQIFLDQPVLALRVLADGSLDETFEPLTSVFHDSKLCVAVQSDGKILLGGAGFFPLQRVDSEGRVEVTFDPGIESAVFAVALQADGKIVVGGSFTSVGGQFRPSLARLHPDGSLDEGFAPIVIGTVRTLAIQADGKILMGGTFTSAGGRSRQGFARLNADGSLDPDFNPGGSPRVINLQQDGAILAGGSFSTIGNRSRGGVARLFNDPASSSLSVTGGSEIEWLRGGSAPELLQAEFEVWEGDDWSEPLSALRIEGGWRTEGADVAPGTWVRASGFGAANHGSSGRIVEIFGVGIVATLPPSVLGTASARLRGEIIATGESTITGRGVIFSTSPAPSLENGTGLAAATGADTFEIDATGLSEETTYFARAYAVTELGTSYGQIVEFTTAKTLVFQDDLAVVARTLAPGQSRQFRFTLTTARSISLQIEDAGVLRAVLRDASGRMIASVEGNPDILIQRILLPGDYILEIENIASEGEARSMTLSLDARVVAVTRPDIAMGPNPSRWVGLGTYRPANQLLTITSRNAVPVTAFARVSNNGLLPDILAVRGGRGNSRFAFTYTGTGGNLTARIVSGAYRTREVSGGANPEVIRVTVKPNRKALSYRKGKRTLLRSVRFTSPVTASSTRSPAVSDGAAIQIHVR